MHTIPCNDRNDSNSRLQKFSSFIVITLFSIPLDIVLCTNLVILGVEKRVMGHTSNTTSLHKLGTRVAFEGFIK